VRGTLIQNSVYRLLQNVETICYGILLKRRNDTGKFFDIKGKETIPEDILFYSLFPLEIHLDTFLR
jgi:hypothetical protein